jgi:GTPase involved in cell partitioning and DNA repair
MTKDEMLELVQEVWPGKVIETERLMQELELFTTKIANRVALVWYRKMEVAVELEREACAQTCEQIRKDLLFVEQYGAGKCVAAIRARGQA